MTAAVGRDYGAWVYACARLVSTLEYWSPGHSLSALSSASIARISTASWSKLESNSLALVPGLPQHHVSR